MKTLEKYYDQLRDWRAIQTAEAIDITLASNWFHENPEQRKSDLKTDFPLLFAPYPSLWMEHAAPRQISFGSRVLRCTHQSARCACLVISTSFDGDDQVSALQNNVLHDAIYRMGSPFPFVLRRAATSFLSALQHAIASGIQAHRGSIFILFIDDDGLAPLSASYIYLDEIGNIVPSVNFPIIDPVATDKRMARMAKGMDWWPGMVGDHLAPFFFAIALMNAKNVSLVDAPLPPKVARRREKDGKAALTFKTLHIEPMRARVKQETKPGESETKVAMHLCRGHFKDYRDGAGLFGKYKGLYWWESQVRGAEENGRVIKDYELGGPHGQVR